MKRITIQNEFTEWAEYLARYFGDAIAIYDTNGDRMWGDSDSDPILTPKGMYAPSVYPIYKDFDVIAYCDTVGMTAKEFEIYKIIVPFIESQLDDIL
jgi:hypothetical protein